jgi:enoyl-CoA hydratase/carnithine racemase
MDLPEYRTLLVDVDGPVALVTFNRPAQLNAFTPRMGRELGHGFTCLDSSDEVREGSTFRGDGSADQLGPPVSDLSPWEMATPVLAAINGPAVGLGLTYPLSWDIRLAAEDAKLSFAFTRRGLLPEANSLWLLSRAVGSSRALELLLTGRTFTGAEAADLGLVTRALPADQVLEATLEVARDIAANTAPASVAATKRMFYEQLASPDRVGARAAERQAFLWFTSQPDGREGISSFLERRPPVWKMSKHAAPPVQPAG